LKTRFGDLEAKLTGLVATDASTRNLLDQLRVALNASYTNFENLGTI